MATPFRDWPWPIQALVFVALAVVIVLLGLYVPYSPVTTVREELEAAKKQLAPLQAEVNTLRTYDQRKVELQGKMEALKKQLDTLQTIVPEDKQVDQFMLMLQGAAAASNVQIRRLTTKPVVAKEYHFEMPFEIEADGPYFSVLDFFTRLSRLSRIINVGDLTLKGLGEGTGAPRFHLTPGTSVTGTFTITTFFTKGSENAAARAPGQPGAKPAAAKK
jgi:type IV pilus assembly protein PilO